MPVEWVKDVPVRIDMKSTAVVDIQTIRTALREAIKVAVEDTTDLAYTDAHTRVPVRKVFAYGRKNRGSKLFAEQRVQGRQETRPMSLEEALGESLLRRKLGLPSAFPTTSGGRRVIGAAPTVQTNLFGSHSTRNRANPSYDRYHPDAMADEYRRTVRKIGGENRIVSQEPYSGVDDYGRAFKDTRTVPRPDFESDLSVRGRYELKRAQGETLGGALKRSLTQRVIETNARTKGVVAAGNDEVDYAKYVEFGTRRSRAQPFLRPALAKAREEFMQRLMQELQRVGT